MEDIDFFKAAAELDARMDKIQESLHEQRVNLFKIEIELDELQNKLDKMD